MKRLHRHHALAFMVLGLLVAATLRLPNLTTIPPGLHHDEAAYGIQAAEIAFQGARPIFIPSYTGREVLFLYLAGGMMRLLGSSIFTLRLTAAFTGLLTVAATYWAGCELLRDRRLALVAAALLAISFWHLVFSRLGFRAGTEPLLQALTVAALFRGLRRNQWRWLITAGIFLGLTAYTYLAARLFPVPLFLASLPLLFQRQGYRRRWQQLAVISATAFVIVAPLLHYFVMHPETFWVRIGQVAPGAISLTLRESYLKSLQMLFLIGDPYLRFNLPNRPLFDWFWGGLLVVGWVVCLWRWRRLRVDWQRAAVLLLLITPLIMLLPTALATSEIVPSNLRALGLIPFIFYLPPIGLFTLLQDLRSRFNGPPVTSTLLAVGVLVLLLGGFVVDRAYFRVWATLPDLYYESDGDLATVADFLNDLDVSDKTIYVAAAHYRHPTLAFLSRHYSQIKWLPGSRAFVFPAEGPAIYIYPHNSPAPDWVESYLLAATPLAQQLGTDANAAFAAYQLTSPLSPSPPNPVNSNFGHFVTLLGYEIGTAAVGEALPVTLYWRVEAAPGVDFVPFVHLEDAWRYHWSQAETFAYPTAQWQAGEMIIQRIDVPVPPGAPPGHYRLRVGLFAPATGERVPRLDEDGRYAGDTFVIENAIVSAARPPEAMPRPPVGLHEEVYPGLHLLGYERGGEETATGDTIGLALWWKATKPLPYLATRLELARPDNSGHILLNTQPVHNTYPFRNWQTPVFLIDRIDPRIPTSFPPGAYHLHLRLLDSESKTVYTTDLGPLTVEATERLFTPPPTRYPLAATFGDEIKLSGYDLVPTEADGCFNLTLVWQAQTPPTADYTVFVHVLDQDGVCCLWQQDVMPRQNQYPTSRWLAGEVVIDAYQIDLPPDLPPGVYPVEVGLYFAETGRRLQVRIPGLPDNDVVYLWPLVRE